MKDNLNEEGGFKWSKFAGLATQWAIALAVLLFLGRFLDKQHYFKTTIPLFIWILPFAFIVVSLIDIIKETKTGSSSKSKSPNKSISNSAPKSSSK